MNISNVTCQTNDCANNGVTLRVFVPEGELVECGVCGSMIEPVLTDEEVGQIGWEPTVEEQKRIDRNWLLSQSDLKMLPDAPWDTTAWATYRQTLRDLPADPAWPDVEFPTPPE